MSTGSETMSVDHLTAGSHLIEKDLLVFDHMYLDLRLVRDYNLGTIYSIIRDRPQDVAEANLAHIKENLKSYQMRLFDRVEELFPKLQITQAEFDARLNDPAYADMIFQLSPTTEYIGILKYLVMLNANNSQLVEKYDKKPVGAGLYRKDTHPVTFHINTWPLKIESLSLRTLIVAFFADNYYVNVQLIHEDPEKLRPAFIAEVEEFHLYALDPFLRNTCVSTNLGMVGENEALRNVNIFYQKRFFAPMIFGADRGKKLSRETTVDVIRMIHATLDALSRKFDWIPNAHIALDVSLFNEDLPPDEAPLDLGKTNG